MTRNNQKQEVNILLEVEYIKKRDKSSLQDTIVTSMIFMLLLPILIISMGVYWVEDLSYLGLFHTRTIGFMLKIITYLLALFWIFKSYKYYLKRDYSLPTLELLKTIQKKYKTFSPKGIIRPIIFFALLDISNYLYYYPESHFIKLQIRYILSLAVVYGVMYIRNNKMYKRISRLIRAFEEN